MSSRVARVHEARAAAAGGGESPAALRSTRGCLDRLDPLQCTNTAPKMVFSGTGQGDYEKVTQDIYVGEGKGSWDKEEVEVHYGWKLRKCSVCCMGLCAILIAAAGTGMLLALLKPGPRPDDRVDCDTEFDAWRSNWTDSRKDLCCQEHGRGCATTERPNQFDCEKDRQHWEVRWSDHQKDWCCGYSRQGCGPSPGRRAALRHEGPAGEHADKLTNVSDGNQTEPYHCDEDESKQASWSRGKRAWCCLMQSKACGVASRRLHDR